MTLKLNHLHLKTDDPEKTEYFVPVTWLDTVPRDGRLPFMAPGPTPVDAYRVLRVRWDEITALEPQYPPSEIYHFVPLDERVPVYQQPFTLVQELVLSGDLAAQKALRELKGLGLEPGPVAARAG